METNRKMASMQALHASKDMTTEHWTWIRPTKQGKRRTTLYQHLKHQRTKLQWNKVLESNCGRSNKNEMVHLPQTKIRPWQRNGEVPPRIT